MKAPSYCWYEKKAQISIKRILSHWSIMFSQFDLMTKHFFWNMFLWEFLCQRRRRVNKCAIRGNRPSELQKKKNSKTLSTFPTLLSQISSPSSIRLVLSTPPVKKSKSKFFTSNSVQNHQSVWTIFNWTETNLEKNWVCSGLYKTKKITRQKKK